MRCRDAYEAGRDDGRTDGPARLGGPRSPAPPSRSAPPVMNERILLIDADPDVHDVVRSGLAADGYAVESALAGADGLLLEATRAPAVVVLELRLPDMPGEDVLRHLRRRTPVPIIVLSAAASVEDRVRGLDLGADDYMTKPFHTLELSARVEAVLRRAPCEAPRTDLLVFDDGRLEIDTGRREVRIDRAVRDVTRTEFNLLLALAEQPGRVQSRARIADAMRSRGCAGDARSLDVHVRNLRRKIEDDPARPRRVETIRGRGYRFGGLAPS
jgi:DNA-binding response OmpR family regulator